MAVESSTEPQPETRRRSRNTKRSSLACVGCKRSKRRCDIEQQFLESDACTNCRDKGEQCEVRFGEDKRRRRQLPNAVDLASRIDHLEKLISMQSRSDLQSQPTPEDQINPPSGGHSGLQALPSPGNLDNDATPRQDSNWGSFHASHGEALNSGRNAGPTESNVRPPQEQCASEVFPMDAPSHTMESFVQASGDPTTSPPVMTTPSGSSHTDTSDTIIGKVIARESQLEGQANEGSEYFGTTSIYHMSSHLRNGCISGILPAGSEGQLDTSVVEVAPEFDPSNEPELIVSHLLDLFWTWQAIHLQVFHREFFLAEKRLFDTERPRRKYAFFSPSLLYAIMALGAMVSPDRGVKYQSAPAGGVAGDIYFDKARKLFDQEMAQPTITTVQTALALGSRYGSTGQSALGWTFSGIAIRMAIQIGLHLDCEKAVASKQMSADISEVRKLVFWGCYIQDKLWSAYTGRPSFIMDWNITVALPLGETPGRDADPQVVLGAVHRQILLLTRKCSKILTELYSRKNEYEPENLRKAASTIHTELLTWHNDLPETLKWPNDDGTPTSPHVLVMYMQFYFTILLLHRPFIDLNEVVATIAHLADGQPSATTICTFAATNIAKLARDYSLFYSLSQIASPAIHFIFIAATIHLINHQISPGKNHDYLFQGCLASLVETGGAYPMSHKAVSALQDLAARIKSHNSRADGANQSSDRMSESRGRSSGRESALPLNVSPNPTARTGAGAYDPAQPLINQSLAADMTITTVGEPRNFDWSNYNSPIALPSSLSLFDTEAFGYPGDATAGFSSQFGYASDENTMNRGIGTMTSRYPLTTTFPDGSYNPLPSATFFEDYYGTMFGLNYNG